LSKVMEMSRRPGEDAGLYDEESIGPETGEASPIDAPSSIRGEFASSADSR
jgi:hypothetical protein